MADDKSTAAENVTDVHNQSQGENNDEASSVGTVAILESSNVSEAPSRVNEPVPVPSVYKDERGEIHNLLLGYDGEQKKGVGKRINVLFTRKGVMRSGDIHSNTQHDFIFSGKVELWLLTKTSNEQGQTAAAAVTEKTIHGPGSYIQVPPYVPHIFHFLDDTVMAEWWEPGSFFAWFYHPYRQIVEKSFARTKPGRLLKMGPVEAENKLRHSESFKLLSATIVGAVLGLVVGPQLAISASRQARK